jgi:hypothetical protein
MLDERVQLTTLDLLQVRADAVVVEDSGWLRAMRGPAALLDALYPSLRRERELAIEARGGPFPLGSAAAFPLPLDESGRMLAIWAITYTYPREFAPAEPSSQRRVRATPLVVAAATREAIQRAIAAGARHVAMPALGTRADYHVLPPVPKNLPRYTMGAAQLIGLHEALATTQALRQVTVSLSQRDYAIFEDLLGRGGPRHYEDEDNDE